MKNRHKPLRTAVSASIITLLAAGSAQAGGFSLYTESSPAAIGNFAAGIAAEAADASIGWYNPAGLTLLSGQQVAFGGVGVFPSTKLTGTSTFSVSGLPGNLAAFSNYNESFSGMQGAEDAFVPSVHYALPLSDNATFGLSIVAPFGLSTDWGNDSPVRYEATLSDLFTANISPELGMKLTDTFAVGAGLDLQYARVKFNRMIGIPNLLNVFNASLFMDNLPTADDTESYNTGDSFGVGYHVGVMGVFNDKHTRIGLNYQSRVSHTFDGYSQLSGPLANTGNLLETPVLPYAVRRNNNLTSNDIQFPDILTLSGYHDVNEKLALLASLVYTGWSCFDTIQLNNVAAPNINVDLVNQEALVTQVSVDSSSPQYYRDTWRAAVGANYRFNDRWMLRVGGGYDQTPTNNINRDVRLPDTDRWALSIGGHLQAREDIGIDVGYTHLFGVTNSGVNTTDVLAPGSTYSVNATSYAHADLVGAQVVWLIDKPVIATK